MKTHRLAPMGFGDSASVVVTDTYALVSKNLSTNLSAR